jgi:hypothetical protein
LNTSRFPNAFRLNLTSDDPLRSLALVDAKRGEINAVEKANEISARALAANKELADLRSKFVRLQHRDGNLTRQESRADAEGADDVFALEEVMLTLETAVAMVTRLAAQRQACDDALVALDKCQNDLAMCHQVGGRCWWGWG